MNLPAIPHESNLTIARIAAGASSRDVADRLDLRVLVSIFRRRLRLFAAIVGSCLLLALLVTLYQPKAFLAIADVVMNKDRGELVPDPATAARDTPLRSEEIDTEVKIIQSHEMASKVIAALKLDQNPAMVAAVSGRSGMRASLAQMFGTAPPAPDREILQRRLADALLANLTADRMETAYAIRIGYTASDPRLSAAIVNQFARSYANSAVDAKRAENEKTLTMLRSRIEELRQQAQTDFRAVQNFRVRNNLLSAQATQLSELEAAAYGQQLSAARAAAAADRGRADAAGGVAAAATVTSPVVSSLRSQRAALSIKVAELSGRYLAGHPDLVEARRELADIDQQIGAEIGRVHSGVAAGLVSNAQATAQQVGSLQGNLSASRATLAANNRALVGLDDLSRKAQSSQSLYEIYLNRYKEVLAQSGIERPEARLLSPAKVPVFPVSPNMVLNLALGLVIGALFGAGAAIAAETNFSGLTTGEDVERRIGVRYGGGIPLLSSIGLGAVAPLASIVSKPNSAYAESVRGLLTSVRQSTTQPCQVIAITSALPGEGKSSLAASMARAAGMAGERVIVVDCDLVRHRLSTMFAAEKDRPGLREVLRANARLGDAMVEDEASKAMLLPITTPFADTERLLEGGNFEKMIAVMREHFSLIILDAAPLMASAEAREIVLLADSVILATLWRNTPDGAIRAALKLMPAQSAENVSIALTRIDMMKQSQYGLGDVTSFFNRYKMYYEKA